ncbi:hypothetical protein CBW65_06125 [Tumebacillus avium]|uniref:Helix-turn-helix domain-containing protein n=1 Tax=Tumebacillus avium TaxID=1903704 RepID=A0A1Y0IKZ2_9BACL|nr:helix-turn-helix domain-containing protein [Tumebacillus avium]ARU60709.1 hypothetical protein CBW65_06125 [Tumebacillus avium]
MERQRILRVLKGLKSPVEQSVVLKEYYSSWRKFNRDTKEGFFAIYERFKKEHLADLEGGPLKLYLLFGFYANNSYGHSWPSIATIADFFGTQTRTIDSWMKVLVDRGLIYRDRTDKKSHTTFLVPYSDTLLKQKPRKNHEQDGQEMLEDILSVLLDMQSVYGTVVRIVHLFHWGRKKAMPDARKTYHLLLIITKREDDVLICHYRILRKLSDQGVSELFVDEPSLFESHFTYLGKPVIGIAVEHGVPVNVKGEYQAYLMELARDLVAVSEEQLQEMPRVSYGNIEDVLESEEAAMELTEEEDDEE